MTLGTGRDPLGIGISWSGNHFRGSWSGKASWRRRPLLSALTIVGGGLLISGLILVLCKLWHDAL